MEITITGDFTTRYRGKVAIQEKNAFSKDIISLFLHSDLAIVNLESPVVEKCEEKIFKIGPHLKTNQEAIAYLAESGVNLVTLANNHFYDYGEHGVKNTLDKLRKYNIKSVGGGCHNEIKRTFNFEKDGIKLAILNYCETEFSINKNCGSNPMNPISVYYDMKDAKSHSDIVIVITHGGHERYNLPSPRIKELYRYFIDLGASVVVNHHQHCYSGYELYNGGMIFYGLGNFFFDGGIKTTKDWEEGFILQLKVDQEKKLSFKIYPYIQCRNEKITVEFMDETDQELFYQNLKRINEIIENDKLLEESFRQFCKKESRYQMLNFSPYSNRYLQALCRRGFLPNFLSKTKKMQILNMLRCESHRDLCIKLLSLKKNE